MSTNETLKSLIESLIFVSQEPVSVEKLAEVLDGTPVEEIRAALEELVARFKSPEHGIQVAAAAGGYIFKTKPEHDAWVRRLLRIDRKNKLSSVSLETLSIIAYHQPITQSEISAVRGVDSTYSIKSLLDKRLIKIVGRKKAPGNPLVYRTSDRFLQYFGLNSLDDLPKEEEITKLLEEETAVEG